MVSQKVVLHFPQELVDRPIISDAVKRYKLEFNILKASIDPDEGGVLVLELQGEKKDVRQALSYLRGLKIGVQHLSKDILMRQERCVHCGACVAICPSEALLLNRARWQVEFITDKCVVCELCVKGCPYGAMEVRF
jgi:ferredoxin